MLWLVLLDCRWYEIIEEIEKRFYVWYGFKNEIYFCIEKNKLMWGFFIFMGVVGFVLDEVMLFLFCGSRKKEFL